ncbi:MAG: Mur ligase family protein [Pseudomonadota bacterium]
MADKPQYFLCGVGGSGMLPLAAILRAKGFTVAGSDRMLDQGRVNEKFDYLKSLGVALFPQDGSGLTSSDQILVASAAVEDTVPDVKAANALGLSRVTRAETLAALFNAAPRSLGVAGTSGKSTTTAMAAWIFNEAGADPTVMNGAVMKNFADADAPFASAREGAGDLFISEIDESDGSIALFNPTIAILTNVAYDHKSMEELRALFGDYLARSERCVVNLDNTEARRLAETADNALTFSLKDPSADFYAGKLEPAPFAIRFSVTHKGETHAAALQVPGAHNVANALAALAAAVAGGVAFADALSALEGFQGVKRRFEKVGEKNGVTVIDDFGHNPDKISATLRTLHAFPGQLHVLFQPHGFGPLRTLKDEFIATFANELNDGDRLYMPEPVYYGGTVDRSVSSGDIVAGVTNAGAKAEKFETREECAEAIIAIAAPGDRVVIMGARDDTLSIFATDLLERL